MGATIPPGSPGASRIRVHVVGSKRVEAADFPSQLKVFPSAAGELVVPFQKVSLANICFFTPEGESRE